MDGPEARQDDTPSVPTNLKRHHAASWAILALITLISLCLRAHQLTEVPNGFHVDEASIGFNAQCILETGRDEHGEFLPLYFEAFGEFKNPVFIYSSVPVMAVLGPDVFTLRFTSALFGALTVFAAGLLGATVLGRWGGVLTAAALAVSPWHFHFSRIAFEAISLPLFVTLAVWLLVVADRRPKLLIAAAVPLAVATYSYGVGKLFIPLLLAGFVVLRARWLWRHRRVAATAGALLTLLVLPNFIATFTGDVQARFDHLSIATHPESRALGRAAWLRTPMGRYGPEWLRESTAGATAAAFIHNYRAHYSLDFLLSSGDANPRHNPGGGMLSRTEFLAAVVGIVALGLGVRRWSNAFLLWWLLMAGVPASLTALGIPHGIRSIVLLPLPQILAAAGICAAISVERRWWKLVSDRWHRSRIAAQSMTTKLIRLPVITVMAVVCLWPMDVGRHLTWYFNVFPLEAWHHFFWEENAVSEVIRDHPVVERFFIGRESHRINNVMLLFVMQVPPREWLTEHRIERVDRRYPNPEHLRAGEVVVCRPNDPRFDHLPLMERIVDPLGQPSVEFRTPDYPPTDAESDQENQ